MPILFILIGSIFLAGCNDDNTSHNAANAWSLQPPILISKTRGSRLSFKEIQLKRPDSLSSSDIIFFKNAPKSDVELKIQTTCSLQEITEKYEVTFPLPSQFSISEVLPPATRLMPDWICSLQFIAKHSNRSEHYFELNQYKLIDDQINKIRITHNPASDDSLNYVFGNLSYKTFVVGEGLGRVKIHCNESVFSSQEIKKVQNLSSFTPVESTDDKPATLYCRAFEYSVRKRIVASSAPFWWADKEPLMNVLETNDRKLYIRRSQFVKPKPMSVFTWSITNSSDQDYYIALKNEILSMPYEMLNHKGSQGHFGSEILSFKHKLVSHHKNLSDDPEYSIYKLQSGLSLKIDLINHSKWDCRNSDHGVFLLPNLETELAAYIMDENLNTLKSLDLSIFEKKWVGRSHQSARAVKDKFGAQDQHSTLPGKSTQGVTSFCRLL